MPILAAAATPIHGASTPWVPRSGARAPWAVSALAAAVAPLFGQAADVCALAPDLGVGSVSRSFDTRVCSDTGAPATGGSVGGGPCAALGADVWLRWTASRTGPVRVSLCGADFDCKLGLWTGAACGSLTGLLCEDDTCGSAPEVVFQAQLGATYWAQVGFFTDVFPPTAPAWGSATLAVTEFSAPPNDTCATALVVPSSTASLPFDVAGASASGFGGGLCPPLAGADVFFAWTAPAAGSYRFRTCGASDDTVLAVHRGVGCAATCAGWNDDSCGVASTVEVLSVAAGEPLLVQVAGYPGAAPSGWLTIAPFQPPTCAITDDTFEDNDTCALATALMDGVYPGLVARVGDPDLYRLTVEPGAELVVAALFLDSAADIDLYLWGAAPCGTAVAGVGGAGALAAALSTTNNEVLTYRNTAAAAVEVWVEVMVFAAGTQSCAPYELVVEGSGPAPFGSAFCAASPNSTGASSVLWFDRPPTVGDPALRYRVAPLPNQATGFLLLSRGTSAEWAVAAGQLCLATTSLLRIQLAPANSRGVGHVSAPFPWSVVPTPILPGDTWHFQYWHRDTTGAGPTANFSRGLSVTFL